MLPSTLLLTAMVGANPTPASYLALGDSYTIGEGVDLNERWPMQLAEMLRKSGHTIAVPEIIARTGWTAQELEAAIDAAALRPPYRLVSLLIGVNDQYRGYPIEQYRTAFSILLERAITFAGGQPQHVLVVSIPDWGVTKFGLGSGRDLGRIAREIDAYNSVNKEIATKRKVNYVDITPTTRTGGAKLDSLTADGLHPSAMMYAQWVDLIVPAAQRALTDP